MRSVLNEEGLSDLFADFLKATANRISAKHRTGKSYYIGGSISKYTKGLLMSFPVLADDSLAIKSLVDISRSNEKNITSMMQMLFASMSINGQKGITGKDVVAIFHKNIDTMPIDDYIDTANQYISDYISQEAGELLPRVKDAEIREAARDFVNELKLPKKSFPISSFNESSINDYMTKYDGHRVIVYEDQYNGKTPEEEDEERRYQRTKDIYNYRLQSDRNQADQDKFAYQQKRDAEQDTNNNLKNGNPIVDPDTGRVYIPQNGTDRQSLNYTNNFNRSRVVDSDFKKANELQPTMLVVNFNVLGDDNKSVIDRSSFIAGIKCRLIATTGMDIAERIISLNKQKLSFKNLIRATTGEIKFNRDFLLAINQQKIDAKNDAKRGEAAKLWNTLKKRAVRGNIRKMLRDGNDASAITTLVISQDTVNYIKNVNKFDVSIPRNALKVMDTYNLLCLVIADDANETARFIYDGNKNFETLSYSVLSKEANERALRQEMNIIQNQRRY